MLNLSDSTTMEQFVDLLKGVGIAVGIVAPVFKLFPARKHEKVRELENRHHKLKTFFDEGGIDQHPLLVESAFAAAIGDTKLDAREIPLILRQNTPTAFMSTYLRVRSYLAPSSDGSCFELRLLAARPLLRRTVLAIGITAYVLFALATMWLLFYVSPKIALQQAWSKALGVVVLSVLFAGAGAYCLVEASRLHWAASLFEKQHGA